MCVLIVAAAWIAALTQGTSVIGLASAVSITLLCVAITLLRFPSHSATTRDRRAPTHKDESAEFRRGLFNLCAALKLRIRFCEEHLDHEPATLIEQLQQMSDHINSFVNHSTRSVRFYADARWPWRSNARQRAPR